MVFFPSIVNGLARTVSLKKEKSCKKGWWKESCGRLAKEARKNELLLTSSGIVKSAKSNNIASLFTKKGQKGFNQVQLTTDLKPNLPKEAERIVQCGGRIFCKEDEPGVYRVWMPNGKTPGLAISRAFGDYCAKDFGLISLPDVTQRKLTTRDEFVILATDGVWDVISNQEAVKIVGSTTHKEKAAQRLVKCATHEWKRKRRGIAIDDMSAVCLFFHTHHELANKVAK